MKHKKALVALSCISGVALSSCALMGNPFGSGGNPFNPSSSANSGGRTSSLTSHGDSETSIVVGTIYEQGTKKEELFEELVNTAYLEHSGKYGPYEFSFVTVHPNDYLPAADDNGCDIFPISFERLQLEARKGVLSPVHDSLYVAETCFKALYEGVQIPYSTQAWDYPGDTLFAYPFSVESNYHLFYDGSVFRDESLLSSWEEILDYAYSKGTLVGMDYRNAWYAASFVLGCDVELYWEVDADDRFISYVDTLADHGMPGTDALFKSVHHKALCYYSGGPCPENCSAVVSGWWNYESIKEVMGENVRCAPLPSFKYQGVSYPMVSFASGTCLGVRRQSNGYKEDLCHAMAKTLIGYDLQTALVSIDSDFRPANMAAADAIRGEPLWDAFYKQMDHCYVTRRYPGGWWNLFPDGVGRMEQLPEGASSDDLRRILQDYNDRLPDLLSR